MDGARQDDIGSGHPANLILDYCTDNIEYDNTAIYDLSSVNLVNLSNKLIEYLYIYMTVSQMFLKTALTTRFCASYFHNV